MTDKRYKLKVTNYMVKKKGMKSCGEEWNEFIISDKGRLLVKRINFIYYYLHAVV